MARKILLADDSVTAQSMGRRILTDAGYEVVTVSNGSAALKKIAESRPDLIVLDVYMPGYGGLEVCQRLKETRETARIPVLLSVGKLEPFKPEEARRVRADAYIVKPFEASELLTALTKLEDKIVPQPEPYKPGRFAKAIAAVEQVGAPEPGRDESFGDSETGWKDRLIIPSPGSKAAEPETEAAHVGDTGFRNLPRGEDFKPVEAKQGFERPIPAGLPADISAEEIAAIAAAAAAVSGRNEEPVPQEQAPVAEAVGETAATAADDTPAASAASVTEETRPEPAVSVAEEYKVEPPADEMPSDVPAATFASAPEVPAEAAPQTSSETAPEATPAPLVVEPPPVPEPMASSEAAAMNESPAWAGAPAAPVVPEPASTPEAAVAEVAKHAATDAEVLAALASLAPLNGEETATAVEKSEPDPVIVAAAMASAGTASLGRASGGPRWIAEPVPVDEQETSFLLEREMEKAYAAFAAAEAAQTGFAARQMETAAAALTEVPAASWQVPSVDTAAEFPAVAESMPEAAMPPAVTASELPASLPVEPAPTAVADAVSEPPASPEATTPAVATEFSETAGFAPKEEVAFAAAASVGSGSVETTPAAQIAPPAESSQSSAQDFETSERQRESELAAAWTNWTQVHQSTAASEAAAQIADAEAGFREVPEEAPLPAEPRPEVEPATEPEAAAAAPEESGDISDIVDNMLAELKPKLMAEISKKLKKGKNKK
ncbi:MAG: response regulator [Acidobacteriia bacterium]|nr:response regulator [Terriglobia bacterium]